MIHLEGDIVSSCPTLSLSDSTENTESMQLNGRTLISGQEASHISYHIMSNHIILYEYTLHTRIIYKVHQSSVTLSLDDQNAI